MEANLREIVQVLNRGVILEVDAVADAVGGEEGPVEVVIGARLAAVGAEVEGAEAAARPKLVERSDVGEEIVQIVIVRRIIRCRPLAWQDRPERAVDRRLIVDGVKSADVLEEVVDRRVLTRVEARLPQRFEDVLQKLVERGDDVVASEHAVDARDLNDPLVVARGHAVRVEPPRELPPLILVDAIDRQPILRVGCLIRLVAVEAHVDELREVAAIHVVLCLEQQRAEVGVRHWIVLVVEVIETFEQRIVRLHIKLIDGEGLCDARGLEGAR